MKFKNSLAETRKVGDQLKIRLFASALIVPAVLMSFGSVLANEMVHIPSGKFIMGIDKVMPTSAKGGKLRPWSAEAFHDEGPAHQVELGSYMINKYEVSNGEYKEFMKATNHPAPAYWDDPRLNKPNQPVVGVNYNDATAFCEWKGARLPTEAEWENAARGPQGLRYPWGDQLDPKLANFGRNQPSTMPVDSLPEAASPYGLHHMAGNAFEWVYDWYDPRFYEKGPFTVNTTGPEKPVWLGGTGLYVDRLTTGEKRVIRGGSWNAPGTSVTTTHRFWNQPMNNSYGVGLGFRCAKTATKEPEQYVQYHFMHALISMGEEKWKDALDSIEKALQEDPDNAEYKATREVIKKQM
ncbi:SUMF1/EgtB/PvdO family nonheme iron enzyme [Candidatus Nitrospira neomarina]|uniref:SUMF1/EgtB/PvdO family nonheme iron enzyme n=1 Tax=Candidatus Nitrospira neomarina TaxID=3020899 RepID=A0AA96GFJ8_9BACT|nr:SUMF1/EgtB/PvdO family nonheme iron enzyme [Candidatus Nitrospira neomarina]WNM60217.1 SUMF1/EgtB/PvdO family nonheme iron enzyme [Candidatus Nitrospira neomarina]